MGAVVETAPTLFLFADDESEVKMPHQFGHPDGYAAESDEVDEDHEQGVDVGPEGERDVQHGGMEQVYAHAVLADESHERG